MRDGIAAIIGLANYRLSKTEETPEVVGGYAFWRGIATPGFIRDQIDMLYIDTFNLAEAIEANVKELKAKNGNYAPLETFYIGALYPFYLGVKAFSLGHQHWYNNLWGNVLDTVNEYRDKLKKLYDAASKIGLTNYPEPAGKIEFGDPTIGNLASGAAGGVKDAAGGIFSFVKQGFFVIVAGLALIVIIFLFKGAGAQRVITPGGRITTRYLVGG